MRKSIIKNNLTCGKISHSVLLHFTDPSIFELASLMGFDGVWMDMEHHPYSLETAANMMRATRVGRADIIARPAKGEFMRMGRMLESGAQGIMYPRCNNVEEAEEVVRWAKFAPLGERGFDGGNADNPYCMNLASIEEYTQTANKETFIIIQLEEQNAIDQAEAILNVEGIDMLLLGPGDFSILSGIAGQFEHPIVQKAIETIATAAKNTGKNWAMPVRSLQQAQTYIDMGIGLISYGSDIGKLKSGLEAIQEEFRTLGFHYGNDARPPIVSLPD